MSNHNPGKIPGRRKPKVSLAMYIIQGLGDPNPAPEEELGMDNRLIFRSLYLFTKE